MLGLGEACGLLEMSEIILATGRSSAYASSIPSTNKRSICMTSVKRSVNKLRLEKRKQKTITNCSEQELFMAKWTRLLEYCATDSGVLNSEYQDKKGKTWLLTAL